MFSRIFRRFYLEQANRFFGLFVPTSSSQSIPVKPTHISFYSEETNTINRNNVCIRTYYITLSVRHVS